MSKSDWAGDSSRVSVKAPFFQTEGLFSPLTPLSGNDVDLYFDLAFSLNF
jgi:hypothetical protein